MSPRSAGITGVVLAGGLGSRMGRDKALLVHNGQTLLEQAAGVLSAVFARVLVVADRADRFAALPHLHVVPDLIPGAGPLGGLCTALQTCRRSAIFAVACDMPALDPEVIRGELRVWRTVHADALVPVLDGRHQPMHAVYSSRCLPAALQQIESGEYAMRAFLQKVRTHFWQPPPSDAPAFRNVNTPDDWARFLNHTPAEGQGVSR